MTMEARLKYDQYTINVKAVEAFRSALPKSGIEELERKAELLHQARQGQRISIYATISESQMRLETGLEFDLDIDDYERRYKDDIFLTWEQLDADDPGQDHRDKVKREREVRERREDLDTLSRLQKKYPEEASR